MNLKISTNVGRVSFVGFVHRGPPPWKGGNYFHFQCGPLCLNMTYENFKTWKVKTGALFVEIEMVDKDRVKIIDKRIPESWLLTPENYHNY